MNGVEMPLATVWQQLSQIVITNQGDNILFSQVRPCGDEENRTLNPRLANSDQSVRRCRFRSLTCADSSSMIEKYLCRAGSRQQNWQHSPAVGRSHAQIRWGRIDGTRSTIGRVPR